MHDLTYTGSVVGCPALRKRIAHLRPRLHVAGHIHESRGGTSPHSSGPNTPAEYTMQDYTSSASMPWEADGELVVGNTNILNYAATNKNRDGGMDVVEEDEEQTVFVNASNAPSGKYAWREDVKVPFGGPGFQAVIVDLKD
ncbi:hypothetical protein BDQ17DRAFT_1364922 [Cyathus striatus]|nr:hypothetical protein BDQ17DRAFT_1364922 [Cyathus striatus]